MFVLSYRDRTFTKWQMQRKYTDPSIKFLPFNRHLGVLIGDPLIVSLVVAWIVEKYGSNWQASSIGIALLVSWFLSSIMFVMWVKGSVNVYDPFARRGEARLNGWVHYVYMIFCLMVILLFYFNSDVSYAAATTISVALFLHLILGDLQPEFYVNGYISGARWKQFFVIVGLLFAGWYNLVR